MTGHDDTTTTTRAADAAHQRDGARGQEDVAALMARARGGDGAAWAGLVERYSGLLWSIARSYGLGTADAGDVVQTTWLRLVERIDRIEQPGAVGRWLVVTARRESLRAARHASARGDLVADSAVPAPAHTAPEELALARERVAQVATALQALPRRCQVLLRLFAVAPSYAELAAALEMPVGSIGPTRARCLESLVRRLAS
ncbi:sigma-70 family RNA polymerase sigma factor [Actinomadura vinacea]|uniref:Sigma-70 family RNA polymerase sigma factor n=1 Tax=Actinomadura vinacea TaxID=115336 RepID=A0ABN3IVT6_9ACTN